MAMCYHNAGKGVQGSLQIAEWFDEQNEEGWSHVLQARQGCDVISLAHFLPHQVTASAPQTQHAFSCTCFSFTVMSQVH